MRRRLDQRRRGQQEEQRLVVADLLVLEPGKVDVPSRHGSDWMLAAGSATAVAVSGGLTSGA